MEKKLNNLGRIKKLNQAKLILLLVILLSIAALTLTTPQANALSEEDVTISPDVYLHPNNASYYLNYSHQTTLNYLSITKGTNTTVVSGRYNLTIQNSDIKTITFYEDLKINSTDQVKVIIKKYTKNHIKWSFSQNTGSATIEINNLNNQKYLLQRDNQLIDIINISNHKFSYTEENWSKHNYTLITTDTTNNSESWRKTIYSYNVNSTTKINHTSNKQLKDVVVKVDLPSQIQEIESVKYISDNVTEKISYITTSNSEEIYTFFNSLKRDIKHTILVQAHKFEVNPKETEVTVLKSYIEKSPRCILKISNLTEIDNLVLNFPHHNLTNYKVQGEAEDKWKNIKFDRQGNHKIKISQVEYKKFNSDTITLKITEADKETDREQGINIPIQNLIKNIISGPLLLIAFIQLIIAIFVVLLVFLLIKSREEEK
ncbi:MAG: hypothetical protein BTN85_0206 [Candidatus Methanohalarchaeum thermophilum]|uniref:Uncharacterized protein n=1 Tax=Methanohalarchaeum thermophilum TaxID=1903181 RepID=A0A1Q6DTR5_METT1|nr:MAG: hypothetical protein BTN85_0206 [Candidatus Methanohalarchaeum thermophilum]